MALTPEQIKYAGIRERGTDALRTGNILPFTTPIDLLEGRFNVSTEFDTWSRVVAQNQITFPLQEIERQQGLGFIIADRDYRLHSTIQEGAYKKEPLDIKDRENIYRGIATSTLMDEIVHRLHGINIEFNHVIPDRGNILLASDSFSNHIKLIRQELMFMFQLSGLETQGLSMDNILHCSFARIVRIPEQGIDAESYLQAIDSIHNYVQNNPIKMRIGNVYTASPLALMERSRFDATRFSGD